MSENTITIHLEEWDRVVARADELMKANQGHRYIRILKTRCQYCGRSPRQRGKCHAWPTVLVGNILFVLMNRDKELSPSAEPPKEPR